jgi:hypothetical protein
MREKILAIRVSKVEKKRLEKEARRQGCPLSDLVRWALRRELSEKTDPTAGGVAERK